ncbi:hypothetical protein SDC9_151252 [bioreactor metagenome]|uniref:Uncharacterized protein n=1 Tax=bioreactor metagenome TaxID=1076179 RepID=A0A645ERD7_9ZZZZ
MPFEFPRKRFQPVHHPIQPQARTRAVHRFEILLRSGIQGGRHNIGRHQRGANVPVPEQRPVGYDRQRFRGTFLDRFNQFADSGMKRRFARTGQGNIVERAVLLQLPVHFPYDFVQREILLALHGFRRRPPQLTVDAIERTGFIRHQIDAQRFAKPPRRNRTEDVF